MGVEKCKNRGWETFVDLTTHSSSVVKSTCIVSWPRVYTYFCFSI